MLAVAAACTPAPDAPDAAAIAQASGDLSAYLDAEFEEELALSPESLTRLGRKETYDKLDDRSEAAADAELAWRRQSVADMKARFDPAMLNDDARTSFAIWENELERAELGARYRRHTYIFARGGAHVGLPNFLITYHKVDEPADMDAYVARLGAMGGVLDQLVQRARLAAGEGVRPPAFAFEMARREATNIITGAPFDPGPDSPLLADARKKLAALAEAGKLSPEQAASMQAKVSDTLLASVKPAYDRLIAWLDEDVPNAPSGKVGALTLPDGEAYYDAVLNMQTTTDLSADEIHELGLAEVARIHADMEAIRATVGFDGDRSAFFEFMRSDPRFYLPDTDEGRAQYLAQADTYLKAMYARLPEFFGRLPKAPLEVRRVEAYREEPGGAAHYFRPTPDGSQPGIFYAHLSDMSAVSLWALESLAYHEGVPGHHMQIAIQTELTDIPLFRTRYGYSAYSEGWGLYAEDLGKEMGGFTDPFNDFGRLSSELWRSVRLVVDTGLHARGWTEQEAVDWALANSPRPESSVRSEIKRYLMNPGQATTYKIGMIAIQRLREEASQALGEGFDIRGFHDVVIGGGAMPLPILEARVRAWIEAQKSTAN
jgi:uncharacterized protein (DUF885 family)